MAQDAPEFESALEAYPVKLEHFEGPLDLLIHLIKRNEVNVYDIPVALITEQYLAYLSLMQELDLDVAGEFLVMAATLIHIKSRLLLPRPTPELDGEVDEEDPREALVRRLLEHQRFKAAAELLHDRETLRSAQHQRPERPIADVVDAPEEPELEVDLFSLHRRIPRACSIARRRGRSCCCRRSRCRSSSASSSCSNGCRRAKRSGSRSSSPTPTRARR